jgi:hypothetical protein
MDIPAVGEPERLRMHLFFLDEEPLRSWSAFERIGREVTLAKLGEVVFASPWLPTIVGTDTYANELW